MSNYLCAYCVLEAKTCTAEFAQMLELRKFFTQSQQADKPTLTQLLSLDKQRSALMTELCPTFNDLTWFQLAPLSSVCLKDQTYKTNWSFLKQQLQTSHLITDKTITRSIGKCSTLVGPFRLQPDFRIQISFRKQ